MSETEGEDGGRRRIRLIVTGETQRWNKEPAVGVWSLCILISFNQNRTCTTGVASLKPHM